MSTPEYYVLPAVSVIDVVGADAPAIVNNLTTQEVLSLNQGQGHESFITDVRGKTVGHVHVFRQENAFRMIGAVGQSQRIAAHVDRYTIREDAIPKIRDEDFKYFLLSSAAVLKAMEAKSLDVGPGGASGSEGRTTADGSNSPNDPLDATTVSIGGIDAQLVDVRWLADDSRLMLVAAGDAAVASDELQKLGFEMHEEACFHRLRTQRGFPWYGIDIDESNLPQEINRDRETLSFTKGCYLGQETVARLDAMGQVQRKLVRWSIEGASPAPSTTLQSDGKTVGRLTSVASTGGGESCALGFARRTHFDPGAIASGIDESTQTTFVATVLK
ncbi:CAF17-like 4Fe-4S cluster assembly/insertion protein YgfZ [Novipirellula artificiosorum]|uniref:Putative global regulator n=1 Tax=Novipirellula artificiosorum TaxID=2528016 RepID=A0A5C6DAI1_9BACT|nr:aminomethyltransferase [Novipirellula artificiosorum]TWU33728.1 putative global regulator [Novipirellula artificiosorum]